MDTTDLRLMQQIIAHDSGALSFEELDYRNTDLECDQIRERLESLQKTGVVAALPADPVRDDMPSKFWAVTDQGIEELRAQGQSEQVGIPHDASSAAEIMSAADDALNRSKRIEKIEQSTAGRLFQNGISQCVLLVSHIQRTPLSHLPHQPRESGIRHSYRQAKAR